MEFNWNNIYSNNMIDNPHEGYYCLVDTGYGCVRKYSIVFQREMNEDFCTYMDGKIEYYILFEKSYTDIVGEVKIPKPTKRMDLFNTNTFNDNSVNDYGDFKKVFTNLDDAKKYAELSYNMVYGYAKSFID